MDKDQKCHWVFRAHLIDRAGAVTSIASVFSNEGISVDTIVGHGIEKQTASDGSAVLTFFCSRNEKDILVRKIRRLSKVVELEEHPYKSRKLRKSVIVLSTRELRPRDVAGEKSFLTCEMVEKEDRGWHYFLAGYPVELDQVLHRLAEEGIVKDIVYSIIGL